MLHMSLAGLCECVRCACGAWRGQVQESAHPLGRPKGPSPQKRSSGQARPHSLHGRRAALAELQKQACGMQKQPAGASAPTGLSSKASDAQQVGQSASSEASVLIEIWRDDERNEAGGGGLRRASFAPRIGFLPAGSAEPL